MARQATRAKRKLKIFYYDGEKKEWDWDKCVALHEKWHAIIESLTDHGYSVIDNVTKVHHFFQGMKSTELEAAFNVIWAQSEKFGKDFNTNVSYLGQMVMKKGYNMQSIHIAKTRSQSVKP